MKKLMVVCFLLLFTCVAYSQEVKKENNVEAELIALENAWAKAYLDRDVKTLDRLEADDWLYTSADGKLISKAQDIADVSSGTYQATEFKMSDLKVRVYGDTAVITGRQTEVATMSGKDASDQFRITDVWLKRNGQWGCIASHLSRETTQK
jgi:ketosteroid isomerase-like protein